MPTTNTDHALLTFLEKTIVEAGKIALYWQKEGYAVAHKEGAANESTAVVTIADKEIDTFLKHTLMQATPTYGWLSEETEDDSDRRNKQRVWITDPIDGTLSFIQNRNDYVISIALAEHGIPILAAVYNPVTQELFSALKGHGAYLNGTPLPNRAQEPAQAETKHITVLTSRTETKDGLWRPLAPYLTLKEVGSIAYKLTQVAKGEAHATATFYPKNVWDVAAGWLIAQEAGCAISLLTPSSQHSHPKTAGEQSELASQSPTSIHHFNTENTEVPPHAVYIPAVAQPLIPLLLTAHLPPTD